MLWRCLACGILAACAAMAACAPGGGEAGGGLSAPTTAVDLTVPAGHARMAELLRDVHARVDQENPYLGRGMLDAYRQRLDALPAGATLDERLQLQLAVALLELQAGDTSDAIETLIAAYEATSEVSDDLRPALRNMMAYYLGVAYMRRAETQNCVARHTAESCILPIRGSGVHVNREGSEKAIEMFRHVLRNTTPDGVENISAKWLLNIAHMTLGNYPDDVPADELIPPSVFDSDREFPRFVNVAPELGVNTFNLSGGALVDDFDADGFLDVVTSTWTTGEPMHYFRNGGDGSFTDRSQEAGVSEIVGGLNMIHADYDNDGDLDILVLRGGWLYGPGGRQPNSLLRNDGSGTFVDVTFEAGLGEVHYPTQTGAWADYDNDGDLDLYIGNEATPQEHHPSQLFRNNADGTFTDVAKAAGATNIAYTKAVTWGDYDGDRYPDLYVSNLRGRNRLYHNNADGTFTDVAVEAGVELPRDSFPAWFWDYDNDGNLDLFVSSYYQAPGPIKLFAVAASYLGLPHDAELARLYRGDGKGGFEELGQEMNLTRVLMPMGSNFGDLDGDGFLDFYLGTGYPSYDGLMPNVMYLNDRGRRFLDVTTGGGFGHLQKGHGVAFADLDHDGDQDVFEQMGGAYPGDGFSDVLYVNPGFDHHWIKVRLVGVASNRFGVGARIRAVLGEDDTSTSVYKTVNSGGTFGGSPMTQFVGLGDAERIARLEISWPASGLTQTFRDVAADRAVQITEGSDELVVIPEQPFELR